MKNNVIGFSALLATSILFGSYGLWIRVLSSQLSAYQQIAFRYALGAIVLLFVIALRREKISLSKIFNWRFALFSISIPISFIFFVFSMIFAKISIATVGFYLGTILLGFILGALVFKEKIKSINLLVLFLSLSGLAIMLFPFSLANLNWGFVIGILSGVFYGIGSVFKKSFQGKISRLWLITIIAISSVVVTMPFVLASPNPLPISLSPQVILVAGIFTAIALTAEYLTILGFQNFDLNWGSVILSGEILFAAIVGYVYFQEKLAPHEIIGLLLIFLSMILPPVSQLLQKNDTRRSEK